MGIGVRRAPMPHSWALVCINAIGYDSCNFLYEWGRWIVNLYFLLWCEHLSDRINARRAR